MASKDAAGPFCFANLKTRIWDSFAMPKALICGLLILLVIGTLFLAYSNGANDNFKGVATLFGSGTTQVSVGCHIWHWKRYEKGRSKSCRKHSPLLALDPAHCCVDERGVILVTHIKKGQSIRQTTGQLTFLENNFLL